MKLRTRQNDWFTDHTLHNDCIDLYEQSVLEQRRYNGKPFKKIDCEKLLNLIQYIQYDNIIQAHYTKFEEFLDNYHNAFRELRGLEARGLIRFYTTGQDDSLERGMWRVEINPAYAFLCDVEIFRLRAIEAWYSSIDIDDAKQYDIYARKYF